MLSIRSTKGPIQIHGVEEDIFRERCFSDCLKFDVCHDACCNYGCDVDREETERILKIQDELEPLLNIPAAQWFDGEWVMDTDYPSGEYIRSRVSRGKCVFYDHALRGCLLHRYAETKGIDPHQLKPMICSLFPVTWEKGNLLVCGFLSELPCAFRGNTIFEAQKREIGYYFGREIVAELEGLILKI